MDEEFSWMEGFEFLDKRKEETNEFWKKTIARMKRSKMTTRDEKAKDGRKR